MIDVGTWTVALRRLGRVYMYIHMYQIVHVSPDPSGPKK